ncbi:MAG: molybdenum cofactor biosynthesis protein MoaE [Verrucomicrobiota bacterium]|jgi:molybdopterin synthase catalytic subunit
MKTRIEFIRAPIVPPAAGFSTPEIGAGLEFSGLVRELENGGQVPGLHYEAYEPMARAQLEQIIQELGVKHPCEEILLVHRLGFVPVGEASLFVRIGSRHRQAGLAFMGELIDRLKADVPIWKRVGKPR